jgi:hypothetical protein
MERTRLAAAAAAAASGYLQMPMNQESLNVEK